jgi:hypothetical protein
MSYIAFKDCLVTFFLLKGLKKEVRMEEPHEKVWSDGGEREIRRVRKQRRIKMMDVNSYVP